MNVKCSNLSSFLRHAMFSVQQTLLKHAVDTARQNRCKPLRSEQEKFNFAAFVVVTYENASSFQKVMTVSFLRIYLCNQPDWFHSAYVTEEIFGAANIT